MRRKRRTITTWLLSMCMLTALANVKPNAVYASGIAESVTSETETAVIGNQVTEGAEDTQGTQDGQGESSAWRYAEPLEVKEEDERTTDPLVVPEEERTTDPLVVPEEERTTDPFTDGYELDDRKVGRCFR